MEKITNCFRKITRKEWIPFWIFAAVQLVYHIMMREPEGSDAVWFFRYQLGTYSLKDFLSLRYHTWSSRIVVEGILVYLSQSMVLWKVLDWAVWMLLAWSMTNLFPDKKRSIAGFVTVSLLLIYPLKDLSTAGWIATSMNYTWAVAFGLFALTGVVRIYEKKKIPVYLGILYVLSVIYAANVEQMCAILLTVYTCALLYFLYEKRKPGSLWNLILCWLITAGEFVFIMTCPGNKARSLQESINWMPEFETLGFFDKAGMGFSDTMHFLLTSDDLQFLLFAAMLSIFVFLKSKKFIYRFLGIVPAVWNFIMVVFPDAFPKMFKNLAEVFEENPAVNATNYETGRTYLPMLLYFIVLLCILISIIVICDTWLELTANVILFAVGMASRMVLGFSPTLYVSCERTFLFFYMTLNVIMIWFLTKNSRLLEESPRLYQGLKLAGACVLMFSVVNGLAAASVV